MKDLAEIDMAADCGSLNGKVALALAAVRCGAEVIYQRKRRDGQLSDQLNFLMCADGVHSDPAETRVQ